MSLVPQALGRLAARIKQALGTALVTDVSAFNPSQWVSILREPFAGAWQRSVVVESLECLLAFSTVYSCLSLISGDISTLRMRLQQLQNGVWQEVANPAYSPVLRKPNRYQTRIQFLAAWIISKLLWGNTYVIKQRDARGVVTALYILDPRLVRVSISSDGGVYYQVSSDPLSQLSEPVLVPASEIIHDRAMCPFHPLVGVGPLYAAGMAATQGRKIQSNSTKFFENMSRPSGHLTAEGNIPDETALRLKREFEERFSGENIGKLLVTGSGLKYESLSMPAEQAQLIEQLKWTGEDCCRPFLVPAYKVGLGDPPTFNNVAQLAQEYLDTCLKVHIEGIECLLTEGLGLAADMRVDLDESGLLRMDPVTRADYAAKLVGAGILSPDEGREGENRPPLPNGSGKEPFLQQQNFPISVLAKRTDVSTSSAAPAAAPAPAALPSTAVNGQAADSLAFRITALEHVVNLFAARMPASERSYFDSLVRSAKGLS